MENRLPEKTINTVIAKVLADAREREETAGYNGDFGDGGAHRTRELIDFFRCGQQGVIPERWKPYLKETENEADPDFVTYQRLRDKFEK